MKIEREREKNDAYANCGCDNLNLLSLSFSFPRSLSPLLNPLTSRSFFSLFPYFFSQVHICIASTWWMSIDDIIRQTRRAYINIKQPSDLSEIENVYQKWIPSKIRSFQFRHMARYIVFDPLCDLLSSLMEGSFSRLVQTSSLWQLILSSSGIRCLNWCSYIHSTEKLSINRYTFNT